MTDEARALWCVVMRQELVFHALLHDLRGNTTTLMGWHSLLGEVDEKPFAGLERSIDGLLSLIESFAGANEGGWPDHSVLLEPIAKDLGVEFSGETGPVELCGNRFEAACWLSGVQTISVEHTHDAKVTIRLSGLQDEGLRLLLSPQSGKILAAVQDPGPVLGTCLFKEVSGGSEANMSRM